MCLSAYAIEIVWWQFKKFLNEYSKVKSTDLLEMSQWHAVKFHVFAFKQFKNRSHGSIRSFHFFYHLNPYKTLIRKFYFISKLKSNQ